MAYGSLEEHHPIFWRIPAVEQPPEGVEQNWNAFKASFYDNYYYLTHLSAFLGFVVVVWKMPLAKMSVFNFIQSSQKVSSKKFFLKA